MTKKLARKASTSTKKRQSARDPATSDAAGDRRSQCETKSSPVPPEPNALLDAFANSRLIQLRQGGEKRNLRGAAQEAAPQAQEGEIAAQLRRLAGLALANDPDCVDALAVLADLDAHTPEEAIAALRKAVAAGERSLGTPFFDRNKGNLWSHADARPYMRVLGELADLLRGRKRFAEAIHCYEKMLALNPKDNQGARNPLLGLYLATKNLAAAGLLLHNYKKDSMATLAWGRVLERFLAGDLAGAHAALLKARRKNAMVGLYLRGQRALPRRLLGDASPGSEEEAILCLDALGPAWAEHKGAVFWLLDEEPLGPNQGRARKKPIREGSRNGPQ